MIVDLKGAILRNFYGVGTLVREPSPSEYFSLKVPHYQRPYRWDESRIAQLIRDWSENRSPSKRKSQDYFAGAVVTVASDGVKEHSIIDGQQRVTTLFLTNYINFTVIRHLILVEIQENSSGRLRELAGKLIDSASFLFRDESILDYFEQVANDINDLAEPAGMIEMQKKLGEFKESGSSDEAANPMKEYYKKLWISIKTNIIDSGVIDRSELEAETVKILTDNIRDDSLNLHYDRASYNASLAKVLRRFFLDTRLGGVSGHIIDNDSLSESEKVYTTALFTIQNEFMKIVENRNSVRAFLINIYELINGFLDQVKFCVIQTGAVDDAYTLFEVMNDRALALDDLDLIKNQFFKEFVQKNKTLTDKQLDEKIQDLDKQWGDEIFNHRDIRESDKQLIPYLSTVFFTGDASITNKNDVKFRVHLSDYLNKIDEYDYASIQRDFNIFQVCYELIRLVRLPYRTREREALAVEYELGTTDFYKTMHFLNAQKQEGVISGLVNFVLRTIANFSEEFDVEFSCTFIEWLLMSKTDVEANINKHERDQIKQKAYLDAIENIHKQSKVLWQTSMMATKADVPRDLARELIMDNNLSNIDCRYALKCKEAHDSKALFDEFSNWLKHWNYTKDSDFKIKTLFARLLKLNKQGSKLVSTPLKTTIDTNLIKTLELDHLVSQNFDANNEIFKFADDDQRDLYLHGLGNMMLLPKKQNIQKSNKPLESSIQFYDLSGLDKHFLIIDLNKLLEKLEKEDVQKNLEKRIQASTNFFTQRRESLINYFTQAVFLIEEKS